MCYMPASMAYQFYKDNIFDDDGRESLTEWLIRMTCNHLSSVTMSPLYLESVINQKILYETGKVVLDNVKIPVGSVAGYRVFEAKERLTAILKDMQWIVTAFELVDKELILTLTYQE